MAYVPPNPNGSATSANSAPVVIASDQAAVPVSVATVPSHPVTNAGTFPTQAAQSGTWIVQPGNTANTTAWKVDGSGVTQPVSASSLPLPSGAATSAKQPALGTAGSASTDVITVQGIASGTPQPVSGTFWPGTQPVSLATNTPTIAAGSAVIGKVGIDQTTVGTTNAVALGYIGSVAISAGTGVSGTGVQRVVLTSDYLSTALVRNNPTTSGGVGILYTGSIGNTATSVKSSAGQIYQWAIGNSNTSGVYVQLFNTASGSVTVGTTTPVASIYIPAGGGSNLEFAAGLAFTTAITVACTTTRTGSTSPTNTVDLNFMGV